MIRSTSTINFGIDGRAIIVRWRVHEGGGRKWVDVSRSERERGHSQCDCDGNTRCNGDILFISIFPARVIPPRSDTRSGGWKGQYIGGRRVRTKTLGWISRWGNVNPVKSFLRFIVPAATRQKRNVCAFSLFLFSAVTHSLKGGTGREAEMRGRTGQEMACYALPCFAVVFGWRFRVARRVSFLSRTTDRER